MRSNAEIKQKHLEKSQKQYLQEATALFQQVQSSVKILSNFASLLDSLNFIEKSLSSEANFTKRKKLIKEFTRLLNKCKTDYQSATSANAILSIEKRDAIFSVYPELKRAKELVNSILESNAEIERLTLFNENFINTQINPILNLEKLIKNLNRIFSEIEQFRKKDFYDFFNKIEFIEIRINEFISLIENVKDQILNINIILNKDDLLKQLEIAAHQFKMLPDSLSELSRNCENNIILPASNAIWNVKYACEIILQQTQGKYPLPKKQTDLVPTSSTTWDKENTKQESATELDINKSNQSNNSSENKNTINQNQHPLLMQSFAELYSFKLSTDTLSRNNLLPFTNNFQFEQTITSVNKLIDLKTDCLESYEFEEQLIDFLLKNITTFSSLIKNIEDLSLIAEAFPLYHDMLLGKAINETNLLENILKKATDINIIAQAFPNVSLALIEKVLSNPDKIHAFIQNTADLKLLTSLYPEYSTKFMARRFKCEVQFMVN